MNGPFLLALQLGEKKKKSSRSSLSNKHVAAAAKKGWTSGKAVEAPLLGGGDDGEFMGSWFGGTIDGFRAGAVLVVFEAVDNLPFMRAAQGEAVTEGEEDSTLEAWVNYEMLRPRAPPTPNGFEEAMEEGCALEVRLQGGWWEVELVRKAMASCERLTVRRRERGERAQGGQHPVQGEMEVGLEALRPGWQWKSGKWIGNWNPKASIIPSVAACCLRHHSPC